MSFRTGFVDGALSPRFLLSAEETISGQRRIIDHSLNTCRIIDRSTPSTLRTSRVRDSDTCDAVTGRGELQWKPGVLAGNYFTGWFEIDVSSCLPVNYVGLLPGVEINPQNARSNKMLRSVFRPAHPRAPARGRTPAVSILFAHCSVFAS